MESISSHVLLTVLNFSTDFDMYVVLAIQVQIMASFKKLLDINGILNPYKVLPHSVLSPNAFDV